MPDGDDATACCGRACIDVASELPLLLDRVARRPARGRGRRGARTEPAGGVHPPDRKGAARMIADAAARQLDQPAARPRRAGADVPAADRVLLDLRDGVRRPGRRRHARRSASRSSTRTSEFSRGIVDGLLKESSLRVRRRPTPKARRRVADRGRAEALVQERRRAGRGRDLRQGSARRSRAAASAAAATARSSCSPTSRIRSRRRWSTGCCRKSR